jgi:hypothetical protein
MELSTEEGTFGVRVVKTSLNVKTRSIDSAEMVVGAVVHVDVAVVVVVEV